MAEQWVKLLAHWKGCEVFQNVGCTGKTDIVIIHPELGAIQVDVKCSVWKTDTAAGRWKSSQAYTVERPVYAICGEPDGDIANWSVSWNDSRTGCAAKNRRIWGCPPGWEASGDNDTGNNTKTPKDLTHKRPKSSQ